MTGEKEQDNAARIQIPRLQIWAQEPSDPVSMIALERSRSKGCGGIHPGALTAFRDPA